MGNNGNSQLLNSQGSIENYTFLKNVSQNKQIYTENQSGKQYLAVSKSFSSHEVLLEYQEQVASLIALQHPYYLNEREHIVVTNSNLCSVQHKVLHFFEHEAHSMEKQLNTRSLHKRYFEQKEIWSILCSCVLAMSYLTKMEVNHTHLHPGVIAIDRLGMIKILSDIVTLESDEAEGWGSNEAPATSRTQENSNHQQEFEVKPMGPYYSPQQLKALRQERQIMNGSLNNSIGHSIQGGHYLSHTRSPLQISNSNKSCMFSLGVTLLNILSLESMNDLYDYDNLSINFEELNAIVEAIPSEEMKRIISKMVKPASYDRISFPELEEMLYSILETNESESEQQCITERQSQQNNPTETQHQQLERLEESINRVDTLNARNNKQLGGKYTSSPTSGCMYLLHEQEDLGHGRETHSMERGVSLSVDIPVIDEEDVPIHGETVQNNSQIYNKGNINRKSAETPLRDLSTNFHNRGGQSEQRDDFKRGSVSTGKVQSLSASSETPVYVTQVLTRGTYEGHKLNKMRHGFGTFTYSEGGKYSGEWYENKMQGRGVLYYANDQMAYEGEWADDKLHGYGVLYNEYPEYFEDNFDYKGLHMLAGTDFWVKYEGNFVADEKDGEGTLFLSNNQCYRGYFKQDLPHGKGIYTTREGQVIKGNWVLGVWQQLP